MLFLYITIVIIYIFRTLASSIHQIHIVQSHNFTPKQYAKWIISHPEIFISKDELIFLSLEVIIIASKFFNINNTVIIALLSLLIAANVLLFCMDAKKESRCESSPLVVTKDVEITLGISMSIICSLSIVTYIFVKNISYIVMILLLIDILTPVYILICKLIISLNSEESVTSESSVTHDTTW